MPIRLPDLQAAELETRLLRAKFANDFLTVAVLALDLAIRRAAFRLLQRRTVGAGRMKGATQ